jgi:hypothetical protein
MTPVAMQPSDAEAIALTARRRCPRQGEACRLGNTVGCAQQLRDGHGAVVAVGAMVTELGMRHVEWV